MKSEIFDVDKWKQEQHEKNILDAVTALAFLTVGFLMIVFFLSL